MRTTFSLTDNSFVVSMPSLRPPNKAFKVSFSMMVHHGFYHMDFMRETMFNYHLRGEEFHGTLSQFPSFYVGYLVLSRR